MYYLRLLLYSTYSHLVFSLRHWFKKGWINEQFVYLNTWLKFWYRKISFNLNCCITNWNIINAKGKNNTCNKFQTHSFIHKCWQHKNWFHKICALKWTWEWSDMFMVIANSFSKNKQWTIAKNRLFHNLCWSNYDLHMI